MEGRDEIDALYALPLDEFTARRNELAARLRKDDRETSQQVKSLPKPPLVAWVVNQLYREYRPDMDALIESGEAMRQAQAEALEGGGGDAMREATRKQRTLVDDLARHAVDILSAGGHGGGDPTLVRLRRTLESLAAGGWGDVPPGRLDRELEPPGMDALAVLLGGSARGASAAAPRAKGPVGAAAAKKDDEDGGRRRAEALVAEAETEHAARAHDLEAARAAFERAGGAAASAERDASELERAAKEARSKATQASRIEAAARAALDAASKRASSSAKELEAARKALGRWS